MGFYYFLLLFIGTGLVLTGIFGFKMNRIINGLTAGCGILMIVLSIFLFQPGSSEVIAGLLGYK